MRSDAIGVGLVGYGLGGRAFHAPFVAATPGLTLRAVASRQVERVRADHPAVAVVPDIDALLKRDDIALVVVSSPDALHAEHALAALRAGRDVLVDKPFATNAADACRVADEAAARGRLLCVFHNRRWDADFLTLRRLIAEGVLGEVVELESRFDRWRPIPAETWKEARTGGSWLDLGPHLVDQAVQLFGPPSGIVADFATLRPGPPAPDWFNVVLRYPGRRVTLRSTKLAADGGRRFAVHGTSGSWVKHGLDGQEAAILVGARPDAAGGDWGLDPIKGVFTDAAGTPRPVPNERGDYRLFWRALAAALRGEGPNPVPPDQALIVADILDAAIRAGTP